MGRVMAALAMVGVPVTSTVKAAVVLKLSPLQARKPWPTLSACVLLVTPLIPISAFAVASVSS